MIQICQREAINVLLLSEQAKVNLYFWRPNHLTFIILQLLYYCYLSLSKPHLQIKDYRQKPGMAVHSFSPSTLGKTEAGGSLLV